MALKYINIGGIQNAYVFDDENPNLDEDGNPDGTFHQAIRTDSKISTTVAPTESSDVLRLGDQTDGSITEIVLGFGPGEPRFRIRWDEGEYAAVREIWNGTSWVNIGQWDLAPTGPVGPQPGVFGGMALDRLPHIPIGSMFEI